MSPAPKPPAAAQKTEKRIPTYKADGKTRLHGVRYRDYSLAMIERLLATSRIVVRRNRRGRIVAAQFLTPSGEAAPPKATALAGTRYSFLETIHESKLWSHRRLLPKQDVEKMAGEPLESDEDRELFVQAIFRAVPLSCLKPEKQL